MHPRETPKLVYTKEEWRQTLVARIGPQFVQQLEGSQPSHVLFTLHPKVVLPIKLH